MTPILAEGDCVEVLKFIPDAYISAVICDPPYNLSNNRKSHQDCLRPRLKSKGFMNKEWDGWDDTASFQRWVTAWGREVFRVLKPGGHLLAMGSPRTYHRLACGLEDAGFEIRDCLMWLYGQGFPKSHNVALGIDKHLGHGNRGRAIPTASTYQASDIEQTLKLTSNPVDEYEPKTAEAKPWVGWGNNLKPAYEPILLGRRPLVGTIARNVLEHGTGAINIDATRIPGEPVPINHLEEWSGFGQVERPSYTQRMSEVGRWPANVVLDESVAEQLEQSRYFYCAKVSKTERNEGLDSHGGQNSHVTVKPIALMRWLVRMVTPPGGIILDPFLGSGTTGIAAELEGFDFIGIEQDAASLMIAQQRIGYHSAPGR